MTKITIPPLKVDVNDGQWHGHNGGEMPVHLKTEVDAISNGMLEMRNMPAHEFDWFTLHGAYRVTRAHVEPPKPREWWIVRGFAYSDVTYAMNTASGGARSTEVIHVREVMTDE